MEYEVKNRVTGKVQFTAEIDCSESSYTSIKLGLSVKWAIKNGADLRGADLSGANLSDADLRDADLRGADLRGANLRRSSIVSLGQRSDGYDFYMQVKNDGIWILAGCRYFPIIEAKAHWDKTRPDCQLGDESRAFIAHAESLAKIRKML